LSFVIRGSQICAIVGGEARGKHEPTVWPPLNGAEIVVAKSATDAQAAPATGC
jgi:hypothetical protein